MTNKKILTEYKKQNPAKYVAKFGTLDPEILEGVIGMTNPTALERKQGVDPVEIWKEYSLPALRKIGGVKIIPSPIIADGGTHTPEQVDAEVASIMARMETAAEVTE